MFHSDWRSPVAMNAPGNRSQAALPGNAFVATRTTTAIIVSSRIRKPMLP
jgi:hypothetical protein